VRSTIDGGKPSDEELAGNLGLLIGRGFDTTTALTARR
jgi:cytochrome P450